MATLFCTLVLTLHKTVLYAFHRGILRLHDTKPASVRVFYFKGCLRVAFFVSPRSERNHGDDVLTARMD